MQRYDGAGWHTGSGALCDLYGGRGYVLTAWHVLRDTSGQIVCRFPATGSSHRARLFAKDETNDIAILEIEPPRGIKAITISSTSPEPGQFISVAGFGGEGFSAYGGKVLQTVDWEGGSGGLVRVTSCDFRNGDSGGPVMMNGMLCGHIVGSNGTGYATCGPPNRPPWFIRLLPWRRKVDRALSTTPPAPTPPAEPTTPTTPPATADCPCDPLTIQRMLALIERNQRELELANQRIKDSQQLWKKEMLVLQQRIDAKQPQVVDLTLIEQRLTALESNPLMTGEVTVRVSEK